MNRLALAVRRAGGVVAWVRSRMDKMPRHFAAILGDELAAKHFNDGHAGGPGTTLWHELHPERTDVFAVKSGASAFFPGKCDLKEQLAHLAAKAKTRFARYTANWMHNRDNVLRAGIFIAASAAIALLTQRSLKSWRYHGFYRFFAFESVLALILLNAPDWFSDMLSLRQAVSSLLLTASLLLAIEALRLLLKIGKPVGDALSGSNLRFENTTALVQVGLYRFVRHPMYASVLALAWGTFLKRPGALGLGLAIVASGFLAATSVVEERENLAKFGPSYAAYMKSTRRFVPFLF